MPLGKDNFDAKDRDLQGKLIATSEGLVYSLRKFGDHGTSEVGIDHWVCVL